MPATLDTSIKDRFILQATDGKAWISVGSAGTERVQPLARWLRVWAGETKISGRLLRMGRKQGNYLHWKLQQVQKFKGKNVNGLFKGWMIQGRKGQRWGKRRGSRGRFETLPDVLL